MAFTVEDGTGLPGAESYRSVQDFKDYCAAHGLSYAGRTDPQIEQASRRGTRYLDGRYRMQFPGTRTNGRDQALEWPRMNVVADDGTDIPSDELPRELLDAHSEATYRELMAPGSLTPDFVEADRVTSEQLGPLQVTYADASGSDAVRPVVTLIDELMQPLLLSDTVQQGRTAFLLRA